MQKEMKKSTVIIALVVIILVQLLVRIYVGNQKEYFHIDEAYSYSLMNYDKIQITDNDDFYNNWHTKDYYIDYLAVNDDEVSDFKQVYVNQKNDVHPPLFYLLLRIAATCTVNEFTKWTGLILNMIIFVFSSIFIYLIGERLFKSKPMALFVCLITGLTMGSLDTTAYIRMYELANMFVLILTYLHMRLYEKEEIQIKDLIPIAIVALLASLTHYYTIIYMAVLFIIFAIKYIKNKQYKNLAKYVATFAIAAILSLAIFPYSLQHMFGGYRGQGAASNLANMDTFFQDMGQYLNVMNKGALNNFAIILIIIYIILARKRKQNNQSGEVNKETDLIFFPTIIYFILVAKMSPYKELRYMMPIIPLTTMYVIYTFNRLFKDTLKGKKAEIATVVLFTIMAISPLFTGMKLDFTYTKMNHLADKMEEKSDIPALYIFDETNIRFLDDIYMLTKIDESYIMSSTKANIENIVNVLNAKDTSKGLIFVYNYGNSGVDIDKIKNEIMGKYNYTQAEDVQLLNIGKVIYLH